jgi:hypothetical protein
MHSKTKPVALEKPFPATDTIPNAGKVFFGANRGQSYRLAKAGAIVTMETGPRSKVALMHVTARKLGLDPTK